MCSTRLFTSTLANIDPALVHIYQPTIIVECRVWAAIDDSVTKIIKDSINAQLLKARKLNPDDFDYM